VLAYYDNKIAPLYKYFENGIQKNINRKKRKEKRKT